jgi:hypothetical protein
MTAIVPNNLSAETLGVEAEATQRLQTAVSQIVAGTDDARLATTVDEFTPSTQIPAEQAAGIFTVSQLPLLSPAARSVLGTAAASALVTPNPAVAAANNTPAATAASEGAQLQKLNISLSSLGLDSANIGKIDSIASVTKDFNPAAFTILAYQLRAEQVSAEANATTPPLKTRVARA